MYDFHTPCTQDIPWLKKALAQAQSPCCDYTVGNLLGWSSFFNEKIAKIEDCLVMNIDANELFGFPQGSNYKKALAAVISSYENPSFFLLTDNECEILEEMFPGKYNYYPSENHFDYVYRTEELATLKGRKYHSKRNHISYFEKNFDWKYEELSSDSLAECIKMNEEWFRENEEKDPYGIDIEHKVLNFALENYESLNFRGGLIRVDGSIVAFTFGEKLNDNTFNTHFEKAYSTIRGAYPMINMLFARETISDFEFVNREDDAGSEGLRKAKLSYHPEFIVRKYTAVKI